MFVFINVFNLRAKIHTRVKTEASALIVLRTKYVNVKYHSTKVDSSQNYDMCELPQSFIIILLLWNDIRISQR